MNQKFPANVALGFCGLCAIGGYLFHAILNTPPTTNPKPLIIQIETAPDGRFEKFQSQEESIIIIDKNFKTLYYPHLDQSTGKYKIISPVYDHNGQAMRATEDRER